MGNSDAGVSSGDETEVDTRFQGQDLTDPEELNVKKKKPGIIYLSTVPETYGVAEITNFFSRFGQVGHVYLRADPRSKTREGYIRRYFEGWVEFLSKRAAKRVAASLNCTQVGGKRKNKAYHSLWNIKYLPRFKWVHLSERLNYERAVRSSRMRKEIDQVKREAERFKDEVSKETKKKQYESNKKKRKRNENEEEEQQDNPSKKHLVFLQQEGVNKKQAVERVKPKSKKTKKGRKSKDKEETLTKQENKPTPAKSQKNKKETKKSPSKQESSSIPKKSRSQKKTEKKRAKKQEKIQRNAESGERGVFLKNLFGAD